MKKARNWLSAQAIEAEFHDYKKSGISEEALRRWCAVVGWEALLNKRGLTWRRLDEVDKVDVDEARAVRLMSGNPSMIKRPVLEVDGHLELGFSAERYAHIFNR